MFACVLFSLCRTLDDGSTARRRVMYLYRVPSTEYRVPSTEYRVPSTEYGIQYRVLLSNVPITSREIMGEYIPSSEYRVPNIEYRVPSMEYRVLLHNVACDLAVTNHAHYQ